MVPNEIDRANPLELTIHTTVRIVAFIIYNELISMVTNFNFISEEKLVDLCDKKRFRVEVYSKYNLKFFKKYNDCDSDWANRFYDIDSHEEVGCFYELTVLNDRICVSTEFLVESTFISSKSLISP